MYRVVAFILLCACISSTAFSDTAESRKALDKTLKDYIGLYKKETLDQWKMLFHPSAMIFFPAEDGSVTTRNVEDFFQRQKNYFATRKSVGERLENVQVFEGRRIARVVADYFFLDEGAEKPGKLGLHLVESNDGWKIVSVIFSYNDAS